MRPLLSQINGFRQTRQVSLRGRRKIAFLLLLKILHASLQRAQLRLRGGLLVAQRADRFLLLLLAVRHLALLRARDVEVRLQTVRAVLLGRDQAVRISFFSLPA